ncbi:unnamed protein product [Candidula unifasciata]|uniref:Uncharacterized protein n=1 Tax=Candidula unifasciata TaxID=100452 RepID=A0A8S3ZCT2_9EUPU|nr:unnamed protein product [Candidula unifasciata]
MMCQCLNYQSHEGCTVQHLDNNIMMANVATNRINGVSVGLQVSEEIHSSGNIVSDRKYQHLAGTAELPISNKSEQIVSTDMYCTAFQPSADEKSTTPSNAQHIPNQERGINLINSYTCETNSKSLTPREVFQHNTLVGWNEWSIHKRNVYDNGKVNDILFRFLVSTSKTRTDQQQVDTNEDDSYLKKPSCGYSPEFNLESSAVWNANLMQVLLKGELDSATVESFARLCRVGIVVQHTDAKYYEDLHYDVEPLLNDLSRESCDSALTVNTKDYMHLLQRWMKTYRRLHLNSRHSVTDLNKCYFPLPEDIQKNPECLRSWITVWERFDFSIPISGAWVVIEADKVDLGNSYEIYLSTLRSHVDLTPFDTTVDGEAAWQLIPEDLIANDVMTNKQRLTESERIKRANFLDSGRMERRRLQIMKYFIDKYKYSTDNVRHFLNWADTMKHGNEQFMHICNFS